MTDELSFEECLRLIEEPKQRSKEIRRMRKELKNVTDQIRFMRAWLRILAREPQYIT